MGEAKAFVASQRARPLASAGPAPVRPGSWRLGQLARPAAGSGRFRVTAIATHRITGCVVRSTLRAAARGGCGSLAPVLATVCSVGQQVAAMTPNPSFQPTAFGGG